MWLTSLIERWRNPHNLTRIHHEREARRFGDTFGDFSYGRLTIRRWQGRGQVQGRLHVGPFCSIADGVTVFLGGNHRTDWLSTYPFSDFPDLWPEMAGKPSTLNSRGDVRIGADVWLGAGATILSGVTIGPGAVVAARAVVTRDVPAYSIVAGNPGQVVKDRFAPDIAARLVASAWWERPVVEVRRLAPLLHAGDPLALLVALETPPIRE
jgi:acetyltransferase-like isoleucine patch superfamily enzyme